MYEKIIWYYCIFPNSGAEGIIEFPGKDGGEPMPCTLCGLDGYLGNALFQAMKYVSDALKKADLERVSSGEIKIVDRMKLRNALKSLKSPTESVEMFVKTWLAIEQRDSLDAIFSITGSMSIVQNFVEQSLQSSWEEISVELKKLYCKINQAIKGHDTILISVTYDCPEPRKTASDALDSILALYRIPQEEQYKIRNQFSPYMDDVNAFRIELKKWLLANDTKYTQDEDLILAYRSYRITDLLDLFSATMQEIVRAKKSIKRCAYCEKLFVLKKRSDTLYCSRHCVEAVKKVREQKEIIRKSIRQCYEKQYNYIRRKLEIDDDIRGLFLKEWAQHIEMLTTWKAYKERLISNGACRNYCTEEEFENWVKDKVKWAKSLKL